MKKKILLYENKFIENVIDIQIFLQQLIGSIESIENISNNDFLNSLKLFNIFIKKYFNLQQLEINKKIDEKNTIQNLINQQNNNFYLNNNNNNNNSSQNNDLLKKNFNFDNNKDNKENNFTIKKINIEKIEEEEEDEKKILIEKFNNNKISINFIDKIFDNEVIDREKKLKNLYELKINHLLKQIDICDSKAVEYRVDWQNAVLELEESTSNEKHLNLELIQLRDLLINTQDELNTTKRNYEQQIQILSKKIIDSNI
jgi:hypothetical protein